MTRTLLTWTLLLAMTLPVAALAQGKSAGKGGGGGHAAEGRTGSERHGGRADTERGGSKHEEARGSAEREAGGPPATSAAPAEKGGAMGSMRRFFGFERSQEKMSEQGRAHERGSQQDRGPKEERGRGASGEAPDPEQR